MTESVSPYRGRCYGIMDDGDDGVKSDVTQTVIEAVSGKSGANGFLSEEDARTFLGEYCIARGSDLPERSVRAAALNSGKCCGYRVFVKTAESVLNDAAYNGIVVGASTPFDDEWRVEVRSSGTPDDYVAKPFKRFRNQLNPRLVDREDDMEELERIPDLDDDLPRWGDGQYPI